MLRVCKSTIVLGCVEQVQIVGVKVGSCIDFASVLNLPCAIWRGDDVWWRGGGHCQSGEWYLFSNKRRGAGSEQKE